MGPISTLGPIDPQINGIPARAILRSFENLEERLMEQGPTALTAYMPLLGKYRLHDLEICKSAEKLSEELAIKWLSEYSLKCDTENITLKEIVKHFSSYDLHKSHIRSINRKTVRELGIPVIFSEEISGLKDLLKSLYNQYLAWFDKTMFIKMYENPRGVNWGRQHGTISMEIPLEPGQTPIPLPKKEPQKVQ